MLTIVARASSLSGGAGNGASATGSCSGVHLLVLRYIGVESSAGTAVSAAAVQFSGVRARRPLLHVRDRCALSRCSAAAERRLSFRLLTADSSSAVCERGAGVGMQQPPTFGCHGGQPAGGYEGQWGPLYGLCTHSCMLCCV